MVNNPFWRPLMDKPLEERRALFATVDFRDQLRQMSPEGSWVAALGPSWEQIFVRHSPLVEHQRWIDVSVQEIAKERHADPVDTLMDLALESNLACQFGIPIMNTDEAIVPQLFRHPAGVLALSDAGAHVDSLSDQGFTSYLLGHWVRDRQALPIEEAVRLITSAPARIYGLEGRGEIREGMAADLVLFDPARIGMKPTEMVSDLPGGASRLIQRAEGVETVIVNGEVLIDGGVETEARSGRVLRGC
jgi:N-acyl-D-aspartate/D-glutamate deacylase